MTNDDSKTTFDEGNEQPVTGSGSADGETSDIFFDPKSGISEDEQKEILLKINGIAERRRRSFSGSAEEDPLPPAQPPALPAGENKKNRLKAKKSGNLFPVLVNIAAFAALAGALFVLSSFQGKTDIQIRAGTKVYNSVERALIEEIRKETSSRLEAKENEISTINSRLEEVDSQLRLLYSNNEELNEEQRAAESRLKTLQEEHLASLAKLQNERSRILEDARSREAVLQAVLKAALQVAALESRTRETAVIAERSSAALELAQSELEDLSKEQNRSASVEAQMGGFFSNLNDQIRENRLDDATGTIRSMRDFINTPAFQALRSIQARKELYNQTINTFETMVEEARKNRAALTADTRPPDENIERAVSDLRERNAQLEQTLASITSEGSGAARRLAELERTVTELRNANRTLDSNSRQKDRQIASLTSDLSAQTRNARTSQENLATAQTENERLNNNISARDGTIEERNNTISELRQQLTQRDGAIETLTSQVAQLRQTLQTIQELSQ